MDSVGQLILERQNEKHHLDELVAMRVIYSRAKKLLRWRFVFTILAPVLISVVFTKLISLSYELSSIFILYTIVALIGELILSNVSSRMKRFGASIQENFDIDVLGLRANLTLNRMVVDKEIIRRNVVTDKDQNIRKQMINWYSKGVENITTNIAVLLCQRSSISYDFSVREKYGHLLILAASSTFLILLVMAMLANSTLITFITNVLLPSLPIFLLAWREHDANKNSIDNLKNLKQILEERLQTSNLTNEVDEQLLRDLQDRIFENRSNSPLIPDIVYQWLKPKLEDEMNYSIEENIRILQSRG